MTTATELLAATVEYVEASRMLVSSPRSIAAAVRFLLGKKDLHALKRRVLPHNGNAILLRLAEEVSMDEGLFLQAEEVFERRWKSVFAP